MYRIRDLSFVAILANILLASLVAGGCEGEPEAGLSLAARETGGKMKAPEFPAGLEWLNTKRPLKLGELRGKFVLLDFWTYCCINCMHIIPDLKQLEEKYENELVVIGVHSAKFTEEQETAHIEQAIARYEIKHPVVNDRDMTVWRQYGARAWPTLVLIDPEGNIAETMSGENIFGPIDRLLTILTEKYETAGLLDRTPPDFIKPGEKVTGHLLAFPGKVLADNKSQRLFVADSNHNRILAISLLDHSIRATIGQGEAGLRDGAFEEAQFDHPQGMALVGNALYVADTENHAIRKIDFETKQVTTAAGTGKQARSLNITGPGRGTALNSPWDLVALNDTLYIAMAGSHQLWKMELKSGELAVHAGSGREARVDGPLRHAALAQPSGLTTDGEKLYFADSEVSAIRMADAESGGQVETIAGGELFEYGDKDAVGPKARFQHPLGLVYLDNTLLVADSYNNKIRRILLPERRVETFLGTGEAGLDDGEETKFYEPGGLSVANGRLYIADTNNHKIRFVDLETGRVATVQIKSPQAPGVTRPMEAGAACPLEQELQPGAAKMNFAIRFPKSYYMNKDAPSAVALTSSDASVLGFDGKASSTLKGPPFPRIIELEAAPGEAELQIDFSIYYCGKVEELCYYEQATVNLKVQVNEEAERDTLEFLYDVLVPE